MLRFPLWKVGLILLIIVFGALLALPNLMGERQRENLPGFLPSSALNLGLDLRGGSYLLIEIDTDDVGANQLTLVKRDIEQEFLKRDARPGGRILQLTDIVGEGVRVTLRDPSQMEDALKRLDKVNGPVTNTMGSPDLLDFRQASDTVIEVTLDEQALEQLKASALSKTMTIVRRRVDPDGVGEISVAPQGDDRIVLEAPGVADPQRLKDILSQAGQLVFSLVDDDPQNVQAALQTRPDRGWRLLPQPSSGFEPFLLVRDTPIMTGADIRSAYQSFDGQTGEPTVSFTLNGRGTQAFGQASAQNVGNRFAIILDDEIISAPNIREPILGGSGQITMGSAANAQEGIQEARDLAAIIEAGELPADLSFEEERTVGPGLGADSIRAGTTASIIGLVLVAVFMILIYGLFGGFAVASLAINIVLIIGVLSWLGATLTLPGIAGIILTIGMAVDANVLVFERVREEQQNGRSPTSALEKGYQHALSTIMDANITTFIAAAVLYQLGSGPVKGFAVTLAIGIITSVFTAFVVTRWFTVTWLRTARPKKLPI